MGSLIGVLFGLYIIYLGVKHISSKVGIDFHALFGGKHFFGFIFSIFASVFKPFGYFLSSLSIPMQRLLGLTLQLPKHYEGFMPSLQKFFLLNRFHTGLLMNGKRDRISPNHSFTHSIIVANTGRGKTSSFVIPNIFTLDNCSILVTDLSGDLYEKTSGYMAQKGFEIKTINLANTNKSSMFNPLASVKTDRDILEVVEILFNASNVKSSDSFWDNGAKNILKLIISCLVKQREKEKTDEFCNLANVRFLLNNFGKDGKEITNFFVKYADDITLNDFKGFISGSEKTTQGLISTALSCLSIVGTETIARLTSKNEIDFSEIRNRKTIVYLIIPQQDLSAYSFILNLFYARFFKACFESKTTNTLPVYCLLDEAGHTKIPNLATVIATIRKYKVSISLIFQSLSQMTNLYGKDEAQVILGGGITSKVFYAGCDDETCDKLEKILGNITVQETDKNGRTYTKQTPLMTAQEIRMMGNNQALYLFSNKKPILMTLQPYFRSWKFDSYTKIEPYTGIDRALPSVKYVNLDC